jgi:hypothetical protein
MTELGLMVQLKKRKGKEMKGKRGGSFEIYQKQSGL